MPGYNRAGYAAEMKVIPSPRAEKPPQEQVEAGERAAVGAGLAVHEAGQDSLIVSGDREEVLEAVKAVARAALDAGAQAVEVRVEAQGDAPRFGG